MIYRQLTGVSEAVVPFLGWGALADDSPYMFEASLPGQGRQLPSECLPGSTGDLVGGEEPFSVGPTARLITQALDLATALVDSIALLLLLFAFHHANVLIHYAAKHVFGHFVYVALHTHTFGLAEVACAQSAPIGPVARIMVYLAPVLGYVVLFALSAYLYGCLTGVLRPLCAWMMAFSWLYTLHISLVGLVFQGGALGTVEDQLGGPGGAAAVLAALVLMTLWAMRRYRPRSNRPQFRFLVLGAFPLYALFSYRFLYLTEPAAIVYKTVIAAFAFLLGLRFGKCLSSTFLPRTLDYRLPAVPVVIILFAHLPEPYANLYSRQEALLTNPPSWSFPPLQSPGDLSDALIVADEHVNRVLVVHRNGKIETLAANIDTAENLCYDRTHRRILVGGRTELRVYDEPFDQAPRALISSWSRGNMECLLADENGIMVGYAPDTVARIHEDGSIEPLARVEMPDSMLPLGDGKYLIGNTRRTRRHLFVLDMKTREVEELEVEGEPDNVESLLRDEGGAIWLALGSLNRPNARQIAMLDAAHRLSTVVKARDVEALARTADGQIAFSNDLLCTVYKISRRGGVYPLVHLLDPDDLAVVEDH